VRPERFELPTTRFEAECSIQLSYGRTVLPKSSNQKSNDTRKCPVGHRGHLLVTPQLIRFALTPKPLIALPISTIRTSRLDVRSQVLYPAELRAQARSLTFAGHFWNLIRLRGSETTRVRIDIVPRDTGCELTLTHEGVLPEYAERTQGGWTEILGRLAAGLAQG
jgi:hypothetical protein